MTPSDLALAELCGPFADSDAVHFNNAGVAPMTARAEAALLDVASTMRSGSLGMGKLLSRYEQARATFASLVGCPADNLAFFQTCAAAISQVAFGFPLAAGDRIVRLEQEYPSNAYPWHRAAERVGAVVDVVPGGADYSIDHDALIAAIGPQTRVVAVSWVQFQTGAVVDLARVVEAAHRVGAVVVVDAIQGLGMLPFDMTALGVDAVCGGTHKWLLGPVGHGFLAVSDALRERLVPLMHGAYTYGTSDDPVDVTKPTRRDIRRFEPGAPLFFGAIAGAASIELVLKIGVQRLNAEAMRIASHIVDEARRRGFPVQARGDSPIVTIVPPGDHQAVWKALRNDDISVALRGGGLRLAPHAFNTPADVVRVFSHLSFSSGAGARSSDMSHLPPSQS
jgi:cysteine desulfurase/selenocysteine lyase